MAADLDDDGKIDLFVANDTTANYFFRNRGGFRFSEEGLESGLAASAGGGYLAGMGVACGDFDGDGRLDLAVTNFFDESTTLYHNHGGGIFSDRSAAAGLAAPTRLRARLRARRARRQQRRPARPGAGQRPRRRLPPDVPYAMPAQLFLGDGAGRLLDVSDRAGPPWQVPAGRARTGRRRPRQRRPHRRAARRRERPAGPAAQSSAVAGDHFLTLALEGTTSNRDAVGAQVAVTAAGRTQVATRFGGGSYLSASDPRLHFGLGPARKVDRVEVTWPSGRRDCYQGLAADAGYRLREGDPAPRPLAGFGGIGHSR